MSLSGHVVANRWAAAAERVGRPNDGVEIMTYPAHCLSETGRLTRELLTPAMIRGFEKVEPSVTRLIFLPESPWGVQLSAADAVDAVSVTVLDTLAEQLEGFSNRGDVTAPHTADDVLDVRRSILAASRSVAVMDDVQAPVKRAIITRLTQVDATLAQLEVAGPDPVRAAVSALEGEISISAPEEQKTILLQVVRPVIRGALKIVKTLALALTVNYAAFNLGVPPEVLELVDIPRLDFIYGESMDMPTLPGPAPIDGVLEESSTGNETPLDDEPSGEPTEATDEQGHG